MESLKRCRRLDAEFFVQDATHVPEGRQRLSLTSGPVQRQHEQAVQPFPQRVLSNEIPQLRDHIRA